MPILRGETASNRACALLIAASFAAVAGGAGLYWYLSQGQNAAGAVRSAARPSVRVSVAVATRRDVPVYATGLGSVQASFTIGIHSQVEGIMQEVLFTEGQHVKKGDVLARIDPRLFQAALDQAKGKRMQDIALLGSAEKDLARSRTLVSQNVATQQLVDQQQARVDQLKGSVATDEAAIETAQTQLDYTTIRSPSDGRIGVRLVDPGNLVHASDARSIATVVLTQPAAVMFTLPMQVLDDVRDALARGPVEVTALDQNNRRQLSTGTLLLIDNIIDQATATLRLKAMFANTDERLWPGEFVNARVLLETRKNVIAVPSTVVQRGAQGLFAWVVGDDDKAVPHKIELGPVSGDLTVITAGLDDGDRVVTDGQYKLQVGAPVAIVTAATAENVK
ncbi:MAG TPA: efflux RND transporter periplasmic adaptor subunit [Xanthobacteraceae bacterium]|nr:efflux RND transporter periplasmic adaptor subunit [Xanthobacteraceae bacterium]